MAYTKEELAEMRQLMSNNLVHCNVQGQRITLYVEDELLLSYIRELERGVYQRGIVGDASEWDDVWTNTAVNRHTEGNYPFTYWGADDSKP